MSKSHLIDTSNCTSEEDEQYEQTKKIGFSNHDEASKRDSDQDELLIAGETKEKRDKFRRKMKYFFLVAMSLVNIGTSFSSSFYSFIKNQFMDQMNFSASDYRLFILIPPLPNIILPLFAGQIFELLTLRRGMVIFSMTFLTGMSLCFISTYNQSFALMTIGKTFHQIGSEMIGVGMSVMVSSWFDSKEISFALSCPNFVSKLCGSLAGQIFPHLYNIEDNLQIPLLVGMLTCAFSVMTCVISVILDSRADKLMNVVVKSQKFIWNFKIFISYDKLFYLIVCHCLLLYGAFLAFESYLYSILFNKFGVDKTTAGSMVSIPYWLSLSAPFFSIFVGRFGRRIYGLAATCIMAIVSAVILLVFPSSMSTLSLYIPLVSFGVFLGLMAAYLFPTFPFLSPPSRLRTCFGIGYAVKNMGVSGFGYLGGFVLGGDSDNCDAFILFFMGIFFIAFLISIYAYIVDRQTGGNINSITPKREYEISKEEEKRSISESQFIM